MTDIADELWLEEDFPAKYIDPHLPFFAHQRRLQVERVNQSWAKEPIVRMIMMERWREL